MSKINYFDIGYGSLYDGFGIRNTLFLKGCPLDCVWCHNPESKSASAELLYYDFKCVKCGACEENCKNDVHCFDNNAHLLKRENCKKCFECQEVCPVDALVRKGREKSIEEIFKILTRDKGYLKECGGITISGGEPLLQSSGVLELVKLLKSEGISIIIETGGAVDFCNFEKLIGYVDCFLYDYKVTEQDIFNQYIMPKATEKVQIKTKKTILDNLSKIANLSPTVLRCLLIEGVNDTELHLEAIAKLSNQGKFMKGAEVMVYHNVGLSKTKAMGKNIEFKKVNATTDKKKEYENKLVKMGAKLFSSK